MSKPTRLPEWATDTDYPAGAEPEAGSPTKVEPIAGKKALGWRPGEFPPAQSLNDWQYLVYLWLVYLDAGVIEGNAEIEGDLHVTGTLIVDGATDLVNDLHVESDLAVDGEFTVTGDVHHGNRVLAQSVANVISYTGGVWSIGLSSNALRGDLLASNTISIPLLGLRKGDRIKSVRLRGSTTAGNEPTITFWDQVDDAAASLTFTSVGTIVAGIKTITLDTPLTLGSDGEFCHLKVISGAGFATTLYTISVTFDHP